MDPHQYKPGWQLRLYFVPARLVHYSVVMVLHNVLVGSPEWIIFSPPTSALHRHDGVALFLSRPTEGGLGCIFSPVSALPKH